MNFPDKKILECGTPAGALVSYLYSETGEVDKAPFENHLLECDFCTNEFAALSLARLEVYEWHRDEFAVMPTPRFAVPYDRPLPAQTWLSGLAEIFAWKGGLAAGGMAAAAFAVLIGAGFVIFSGADQGSVAKVDSTNSAIVNVPEAKAEVPAVAPFDPGSLPRQAEPEKAVRVSVPVKAAPVRASKPAIVRDAKPSGPRPVPVQAQRKSAPRLNGSDDETDRTLRLADLLAEIDTDE